MGLVRPENCPCVAAERPVAPCGETCFHCSPSAEQCANCDPAANPLEIENERLRAENRRLKRLCRDVLPRLRRILADEGPEDKRFDAAP